MSTKLPLKTSYKGYKKPEYSNICVAMGIFNPMQYANIITNLKIVCQELEKSKIPYYIIELLYPNQSSMIPNSFTVRGQTYFFVKENLWNLLEKRIPSKYEKIIFLDADVLCSDPEWVNKIAEKLQIKKVVHASEYLYRDIYSNNIYEDITLTPINSQPSVVKAIKNQIQFNPLKFHPGFNVCIDRNFFHKINGFFEHTPVTIGDTIFWVSFIPNYRYYCATFFSAPNMKTQREMFYEYRNNVLSSCEPIKDIDYIENNNCLHLYHGSLKNRNYGHQYKFIPGPFKLYKNNDGVIEIEIKHPYVKDMKKYFEERKDDNT